MSGINCKSTPEFRIFIDRPVIGWFGYQPETKIYQASPGFLCKSILMGDTDSRDASLFVEEFLKSDKFWKVFLNYTSLESGPFSTRTESVEESFSMNMYYIILN